MSNYCECEIGVARDYDTNCDRCGKQMVTKEKIMLVGKSMMKYDTDQILKMLEPTEEFADLGIQQTNPMTHGKLYSDISGGILDQIPVNTQSYVNIFDESRMFRLGRAYKHFTHWIRTAIQTIGNCINKHITGD